MMIFCTTFLWRLENNCKSCDLLLSFPAYIYYKLALSFTVMSVEKSVEYHILSCSPHLRFYEELLQVLCSSPSISFIDYRTSYSSLSLLHRTHIQCGSRQYSIGICGIFLSSQLPTNSCIYILNA